MKIVFLLAVVVVSTASITSSADANPQIPPDRIIAVPHGWATNTARRADTELITDIDSDKRVVKLCGNVSLQCEFRVFRRIVPFAGGVQH